MRGRPETPSAVYVKTRFGAPVYARRGSFDKRRKGSRSKRGLEALGRLKMAPKTASYKAKMRGYERAEFQIHYVLRRVSLLEH